MEKVRQVLRTMDDGEYATGNREYGEIVKSCTEDVERVDMLKKIRKNEEYDTVGEKIVKSKSRKFENAGIELGKLVDSKQEAYGDSVQVQWEVTQVLLKQYETDDPVEHYLIPKSLMQHLLLITRIGDKINRIVSNPDGDKMDESPYGDISGYGLLGKAMVMNDDDEIVDEKQDDKIALVFNLNNKKTSVPDVDVDDYLSIPIRRVLDSNNLGHIELMDCVTKKDGSEFCYTNIVRNCGISNGDVIDIIIENNENPLHGTLSGQIDYSGNKKDEYVTLYCYVNSREIVLNEIHENATLCTVVSRALVKSGIAEKEMSKQWDTEHKNYKIDTRFGLLTCGIKDGDKLYITKKIDLDNNKESKSMLIEEMNKLINLTFVVNGREIILNDLNVEHVLANEMGDAMRLSGHEISIGNPLWKWQVRINDVEIDYSKQIKNCGIKEDDKIFISLKAGVGGTDGNINRIVNR